MRAAAPSLPRRSCERTPDFAGRRRHVTFTWDARGAAADRIRHALRLPAAQEDISATGEENNGATEARQPRPGRLGRGTGLHGDVGFLRAHQRSRSHRHDSPRAGPRGDLPGHGGCVRTLHQRGLGGQGDRGAARPGGARHQLAWVLAQGDDIVPIPATKRREYLEQNVTALAVRLAPEDLARLNEIAPKGVAAGPRYADMSSVNR
jgi:hypothetical protein